MMESLELEQPDLADQPDDIETLRRNLELLKGVQNNFLEAIGMKLIAEEREFQEMSNAQLQTATAVREGHFKRPEDDPSLDDQPEIENEQINEEVGFIMIQERNFSESRVLGIAFPAQFKSYMDESTFKQLRNELYDKEKGYRQNELLVNNVVFSLKQVYSSGVVKGFNTIDIDESIKYFRENYDLDLSETSKNFIVFDNLEVKPNDLFRLVPMVFLNDTTINFYIKVVQKYIVDKHKANEFHFFNTYFFSKLRSECMTICQTKDIQLCPTSRSSLQPYMEAVYTRLKNWYKKIKLFQKKFILMPINKKDHWFTVIIVNLPKLYDCLVDDRDPASLDPADRPYILLMDPLLSVEENLDLMLRMFLELELKEMMGPAYELKAIRREGLPENQQFLINEKTLPHFQLVIPRQRNTFDCGVFALEYMESFVLDPHFILGKIDKQKDFADWFPKSLIENKRKHIINFIINLSKGMDMETNVKELMKQRETINESKREDPDEFDVVNMEEIRNHMMDSIEFENDDERQRYFVRTYYSILPKEIVANMCQMYLEHNFSQK